MWELGKDRCGLCPGRCLPKDLKTKLPFGSPIYMDEKEFPLQQVKDVQARALVMNQLEVVADATEADGASCFSEADTEPKGQLAVVAMSILMGILYCARMARFDLLRIS